MPIATQHVLSRILVAVGGSESSFGALDYALDLARAANSHVAAFIVQETLLTPELIFARGQTLHHLTEELAAAVELGGKATEQQVREVGFITRAHASELPWVQLELSRASFMANEQKHLRNLSALQNRRRLQGIGG